MMEKNEDATMIQLKKSVVKELKKIRKYTKRPTAKLS
jgi:hypothetical protein